MCRHAAVGGPRGFIILPLPVGGRPETVFSTDRYAHFGAGQYEKEILYVYV
jgi:hypothetical protein